MLDKNKIELSISPNKVVLNEINFDDLTDFEKKEYNRVIALPKSQMTTISLDNLEDYED